jgi:hypothetical protein
MNYRQTLHKHSPALKNIAYQMSKHGYYYFDNQKRVAKSWEKKGDQVVITGEIVSPI